MKFEIPVCKRCCFCLPLRYGLIAWGYFKLVVDALIIALMAFLILNALLMVGFSTNGKFLSHAYLSLIMSIFTMTIFVPDFVVTIVFIVAGHKKNLKLLRVYYFFSIAMLVLTLLLIAALVTIIIINMVSYKLRIASLENSFVMIAIYFIVLVVQSYILLLLRSEIMKLSNNCEFKFVNNATEAECNMNYKEANDVVSEETDTEVV